MNILTRIKKAQDEATIRSSHEPKYLMVRENEEHELLFALRELTKHQGGVPHTLDDCEVMGMQVLLEKDVLFLEKIKKPGAKELGYRATPNFRYSDTEEKIKK